MHKYLEREKVGKLALWRRETYAYIHQQHKYELSLAGCHLSHIHKHLQFEYKQVDSPSAKCQFLHRNIKRTEREGTTFERAENSQAAGEQQAISIITNYNVQRTDLGTILADLSGRSLGPLDSLDRGRYWRKEGKEEGEEGMDEREKRE